MPSSRIFAAHFETVDLPQPSDEAISFQLTPLSSWRMISFLVAMGASFRTSGTPLAPAWEEA